MNPSAEKNRLKKSIINRIFFRWDSEQPARTIAGIGPFAGYEMRENLHIAFRYSETRPKSITNIITIFSENDGMLPVAGDFYLQDLRRRIARESATLPVAMLSVNHIGKPRGLFAELQRAASTISQMAALRSCLGKTAD